MGKTAAAGLLRDMGVPVVDTDDISREVTVPGSSVLGVIESQLGPGLLDSAGGLNRAKLAERVFSDSQARKLLESILHPLIRESWRRVADGWREEGELVGVVVIPLLFETAAETDLDGSVCIACTRGTQLRRVQLRGWTTAELARREAAQLGMEEKCRRSGVVVWTEGSLAAHREQWQWVLARVRGQAGQSVA